MLPARWRTHQNQENPSSIMQMNINGDPTLIAIERAINELRCGRAIFCHDANASNTSQRGIMVAAAETASAALLSRLQALGGDDGIALVITQQRAETLGLDSLIASDPEHGVLLRLHPPVTIETVHLLAAAGGLTLPQRAFTVERSNSINAAAVNLAKHARLLPAMLVVNADRPADDEAMLTISTMHFARLVNPTAVDLRRVSEARVPLAGHEDCRLVLFRDGRDASEHVAVVIGSPAAGTAVPVRLHSACLTGDLLGSLRCDCGDQLHNAVDQLAAAGGGVLLYLAQEGRGIGLANKLRAYELQDSGLDTLDADQHLGFNADERNYVVAASMLRQLGVMRIQLLTNNLEKIHALQASGIEVVSGQRLLGTVNRHNVRYISAKRERAGHLMPEINAEELL